MTERINETEITKVNIGDISSITDNKIILDIPNSLCKETVFKGKHIEFESEENYMWYGEILTNIEDECSCQQGYLLLMSNDGEKFGQLKMEDEYYTIEAIEGKNVIAKQPPLEEGTNKICGGAIEEGFNELIEIEDRNSGNCDIRVLVLYTAAANSRITNIGNLAQSSVAITNQAFRNSGISSCDINLDLIATQQVDIDEDGLPFGSVLFGLVISSEVSELRDFWDADIVLLFVDDFIMDAGGTAGIAYQGPSEERAYGVVQAIGANNGYVFSHEVGHILGALHEPCEAEDATTNCDDSGIFEHAHTWSYETRCWIFFRHDHKRKTLMYSGGASNPDVIHHYSNPDIELEDRSTGIIGERDNSQILKSNACIVANFRTQTHHLTVSIQGDDFVCPLHSVLLQGNADGVPGATYTYDWRLNNIGTNWENTPLYSTSKNANIASFTYNIGDIIYIRLKVTASTGEIKYAYHSIELVDDTEDGCDMHFTEEDVTDRTNNNFHYQELDLYPNPVLGNATLSYSVNASSNTRISIYAIDGTLIKTIDKGQISKGNYEEKIDISALPTVVRTIF